MEQWLVRGSSQGQMRQISQRTGGSAGGHQLCGNMTTPDRDHLEVNEFGSEQRFVRQTFAGLLAVCPIITQRYSQYARINDDHVVPERDRRQP